MRDYVGAYLVRGNDRICAMIAASSIISVLIKRGYVGVEVRTGRPTFHRVLSTFTAASNLLRGSRVSILGRWRLLSPVEVREATSSLSVAKPWPRLRAAWRIAFAGIEVTGRPPLLTPPLRLTSLRFHENRDNWQLFYRLWISRLRKVYSND